MDTNVYLHSHDKKYQRIAGGQQEVKVNTCHIHLHLEKLGGEGRKLFTWCFRKCIIGVVNQECLFHWHLSILNLAANYLIVTGFSKYRSKVCNNLLSACSIVSVFVYSFCRFVVSEKSELIIFGWPERASTFQLRKASDHHLGLVILKR